MAITKPPIESFFKEEKTKKRERPPIDAFFANKKKVQQSTQPTEKGLKGFSTGFAKGLLGTVRGTGQLLQGAGQRVLAGIDPTRNLEDIRRDTGIKSLDDTTPQGQAFQEAITPRGKAEKIGDFTADVAAFAAPATKISNFGTKAQKAIGGLKGFGTRTAIEGAGGAAIGAAQEGEFGQGSAIAGGISATMPSLGVGFDLTKRFLGSFGKNIGGALSGRGSEVIEQIIERPEAARQGLRGGQTQVIKELSEQTRQGTKQIKQEAQKQYAEALDSLPKSLGRPKDKFNVIPGKEKTTVKFGGNTYTLSLQGVKSKLTQELRDFGVVVDPRKKEFDFLESPFRRSEENVLKEVFDTIQSWKDTSPQGLDRLAVKIGNFRKAGDQSAALNSVVDTVKKNVRSYVGDRIPPAKEMVKNYAERMDFVEALETQFRTDGAVGSTEGIIETAQKISTIFNKNKELARELVERLEKDRGIDILGREAGRELSEGVSRSTGAIGDSVKGIVQSVIPPRAVGEIAAATGIAKPKVQAFLNALQKLEPTERAILVNFLSDENQ